MAIEIFAPKDTVSDDSFVVVDVLVQSGQPVVLRQRLFVVESSKAAVEIESTAAGYLFHTLRAGASVPVGGIVAIVSDEPEMPANFAQSVATGAASGTEIAEFGDTAPAEGPTTAGQRFSRSAEALIAGNGLDRGLFAGVPLVTKALVEEVIRKQAGLSVQRAIGSLIGPVGGDREMVIVGGGGHAGMCIDMLRQSDRFSIVGILDRTLPVGTMVSGIPVVGRDVDLARLRQEGVRYAINAVGAVGNVKTRQRVFQMLLDAGLEVPTLVHRSAVVEPSATLGDGNQIMAGAVVGSHVAVGRNCIVNSGAIVSHDSVLADNVHIAPGAILGGNVKVGSNTLIGMGVTVYLGVTIGANVVIPNGTHIWSDLPDGTHVRQGARS